MRFEATALAYASERHSRASVTVAVPLYDYAAFVIEALDSVAAQTLADLDLVVVDDHSGDGSTELALAWCRAHADRFGRVAMLRHDRNFRLATARNTGFLAAETPFVLPLDADNRLLPGCAAALLAAARGSDAVFFYPVQRIIGDRSGLLGEAGYDPHRLVAANYVDALALVARAAWAAVGGYREIGQPGWEDYDLWCRFAELGLRGQAVGGEPLAAYRAHAGSMSRTTDQAALRAAMARLHPWLRPAAPDAAAHGQRFQRTRMRPSRPRPPEPTPQ
jgi:glycosyltransferase involved in cell wall biosynthesis